MVVAVVSIAVAYPLWRPGPQAAPDPVGPAATLAALEEHKLRLYASIRELGFDYRTDKLEEADYEEEVDRIKAEAIGVVRQIGELRRQAPRGNDDLEAEIAAFRQQGAPSPAVAATSGSPAATSGSPVATPSGERGFCTQCGAPAATGDRFCASCGSPLRPA